MGMTGIDRKIKKTVPNQINYLFITINLSKKYFMSRKKMTVAIQLGLIFIGGKLNLVWRGLGVKHHIPDPAPERGGNLGVIKSRKRVKPISLTLGHPIHLSRTFSTIILA